VKYAVDHRTALNLAYLDEEKVLTKMLAAHSFADQYRTPVEMRLVTNRTIDPGDVLAARPRRTRQQAAPRAAQSGPKSDRGQSPSAWAAAAHTDEPTLMNFLADFHLDVSYDVTACASRSAS